MSLEGRRSWKAAASPLALLRLHFLFLSLSLPSSSALRPGPPPGFRGEVGAGAGPVRCHLPRGRRPLGSRLPGPLLGSDKHRFGGLIFMFNGMRSGTFGRKPCCCGFSRILIEFGIPINQAASCMQAGAAPVEQLSRDQRLHCVVAEKQQCDSSLLNKQQQTSLPDSYLILYTHIYIHIQYIYINIYMIYIYQIWCIWLDQCCC